MTENNKPFSNVEEVIAYLAEVQRNQQPYPLDLEIEAELSDEEIGFSNGYEQALSDLLLVLTGKVTLRPEFLEAMNKQQRSRHAIKMEA